MSKTQIVELNHRHMAIAEYIIQHPSARLHEIAEAVGMTTSWISIVTNSELFRDYFLRRHKEVSDMMHISLQDKLHGVAHAAVEKLGRAVDESNDANFILAAADKSLKNLGFGNQGKGPQVQVNNISNVQQNNHVSADVVAQARAKIYQVAGGKESGTALPPAEGVQTREDHHLGAPSPRAALVHQTQEASGPQGSGGPIRAEGSRPSGDLCLPTASPESLD